MPNPVDDQEQQGAPAGFAEAALAQIAFRQERIEALLTQVETLTRERDEARALINAAIEETEPPLNDGVWCGSLPEAVAATADRALTAEAEISALRKALEPTAIEAVLRKHIKVDATGLNPHVVRAFIYGFDDAAAEIVALLNHGSGANG